MRQVLPLIALMLTSGAAAQPAPSDPAPTRDDAPDRTEPSLEVLPDRERVCRDRILEVREERGMPMLDRDAATSDEPVMIAAVDHRIGGCSVLVMYHDTRDVRPLSTDERPARVQRIPGD